MKSVLVGLVKNSKSAVWVNGEAIATPSYKWIFTKSVAQAKKQGHITRREIADLLGVSIRTASRDLA